MSNLNASHPDVTARLLKRFQELSVRTGMRVLLKLIAEFRKLIVETSCVRQAELVESDAMELLETVSPTAEQRAWGSVTVAQQQHQEAITEPSIVGDRMLSADKAPSIASAATGYGACEKMASTRGFFAPWLGAGCSNPSGFCGLVGRTCALPSGGGLGSTASIPYATTDDDLESCMAKCKSAVRVGAPHVELNDLARADEKTNASKEPMEACSCFEWSGSATPRCALHSMPWNQVAYGNSRTKNYTAFTRSTDPAVVSLIESGE